MWEPHITTITTKLATLKCLSYILFYDDGATGSVDEP